MRTGIELISEEREKQITKHGFTGQHHADHPEWYHQEQLIQAASDLSNYYAPNTLDWWPTNWDKEWYLRLRKKPHFERLIIAGALLAAEIDRLNLISKNAKPNH